jgi:hypothetical protein
MLPLGLTIHTLGGIMIGITAIRVHAIVSKEMKLDKHAYKEMQREKFVGILGIMFMIIGYIFQVAGK